MLTIDLQPDSLMDPMREGTGVRGGLTVEPDREV